MHESSTHHPARCGARRGNAMVLVAGILVLLVIVATAYITRTQGGRVTAVAVQNSATRDNNARVLGESLAQVVSDALFAWPIAPNGAFLNSGIADADWPRLTPQRWNGQRYGADRDFWDNSTLLPPGNAV